MGELVRWCLYSPRRLVASVLAAGLMVGGLVTWVGGESPPRSGGTPAAVTALPAADDRAPRPQARPLTEPLAHTEAAGDWRQVRRATQAFLALYLRRPGGETVADLSPRVRRLVTPTLWRGLRYTDPTSTPRGPVASVDREALGVFGADVSITLRRGPSLQMELVRWTDGWRVADIQPARP